MALIECPECGGKVSDKATVCIHCGYPLNQVNFEEPNRANEPIASGGGPYALVLYNIGSRKKAKCDFEIMQITNMKSKQVMPLTDAVQNEYKQLTIAVDNNQAKLMALKSKFDQIECGTRVIDISSGNAVNYNYIARMLVTPRGSQQNIPKCPTCGSTQISQIGNLNRAASVAMFGGMSKKINKSFKCENCGYTW